MAYTSINPANGKLIQSFQEHDDAQVEVALASAEMAVVAWRRESFASRAAVVSKAAQLMRDRVEDLSRTITLEMGKLIEESRGETLLSADILAYYATNAERILATVSLDSKQRRARIVNQPIGVLFEIEPWNFPYYQLVRVAAPSLMAANTLVVKHAGSVPQWAELFAQLFLDGGAQEGVYPNLKLTHDQTALSTSYQRQRVLPLPQTHTALPH